MEIGPESGMGGDGARDVSDAVKLDTAALGFRVKSGWAAVVMLSGSPVSPELCDVRRIEVSDPRLPETRQPYHASMGKLETDAKKIARRIAVIRKLARRSIGTLLANYRHNGYTIRRAGIVVGSQSNPVSITNPHIRAHAFEGQLFRSMLEECLYTHGVSTHMLLERDAYAQAAMKLSLTDRSVRDVVARLGRLTQGPWRAEEKIAAVAAWFTLA
jgi:hypothetical protein